MTAPSIEFRRTQVVKPDQITTGLDAVRNYFSGLYYRADVHGEKILTSAEAIYSQAEGYRGFSERKLKIALGESRTHFRRQNQTRKQVEHALGLLVEAAHRSLKIRPYPVQVMAALAMYEGYLAEMATGEGKSLTASLVGVMTGWSGRPCHILTTNDYLASRDAVEFHDFYRFCGVSVGSVIAEMEPENRREIYEKGVVYTTSKELLADFLRDRIRLGSLYHPQRRLLREVLEPHRNIGGEIVLRGIDTAIIDEADSVMIDEAVTPLIISNQQENKWLIEAATAASSLAEKFLLDRDFKIDTKYREVNFTDVGREKLIEVAPLLPEMWRGTSRREEIVKQAIVAKEFYKLDQQYVIDEGKIVIVDEFTGRLMANRSWGNGLHQAVEAKEGLELSDPTETLARLSFQRFFRLFRKLSGMTGTANEAADEFWHIYRLPVMSVPTNRPLIREYYEPMFFEKSDAKWAAVVEEIKSVHAQGRPVLVGVKSVKGSQKLADLLQEEQLAYRLLNATNHADEAYIIREAGREDGITIATNMAGRGTDIKLSPEVAKQGGLHVIVTERNDSGRIDRQLVGRCARQGDPGSSRIFASMEDDLMTRYGSRLVVKLANHGLIDQPKYRQKAVLTAFNFAQSTAQKIAYRQRKTVLRTDTWLDEALIFSGSEGGF
jgi:preprotein translocase subunit SecA